MFCNVTFSNLENNLQKKLRTDRVTVPWWCLGQGATVPRCHSARVLYWCLRGSDVCTGLSKGTFYTLLLIASLFLKE